ncbi:hypothetical protein ADUPG1_014087, partial [Aduncisulcus paluster]
MEGNDTILRGDIASSNKIACDRRIAGNIHSKTANCEST